MVQFGNMVPALGAHPAASLPGYWLILAVVVLAFVLPMAYLFGRNGSRPDHS